MCLDTPHAWWSTRNTNDNFAFFFNCMAAVWTSDSMTVWPLSKKHSKDQESMQSSTTPVPGYQMGM